MKLLKILAVLLLVVLLLMGAAAVYITQVFDPNDYKPQLVELVREQTGRELSIDGDLELTLFPWLGVRVGAARLSNPPSFDGPFGELESATIRIKVVPLLSRRVETDQVLVEGLGVHLIRAEDGRTNWEDLVAGTESAAGPPTEPTESEGGLGLADFTVDGLRIADAALTWDDRVSGQRFSVSDANLSTGTLTPGQPVDLEGGFQLQASQPELTGAVEVDGTVEPSADGQRVNLNMNRLSADLQGAGLPAETLQAVLEFVADLDLAAQRYVVSGANIDLNLEGGDLPGKAIDAEIAFDAAADLAADTAEISKLAAKALGLDLSAGLKVEGLTQEPSYRGLLKVEPFSPRSVIDALGVAAPVTADASVLKTAALNAGLAGNLDRVALSNLTLRLDDSSLTGSAAVENFAKPALGFDLKVDRIDLDRYLPPPSPQDDEAGKRAGERAGVAGSPGGGPPLAGLRSLKLDGKLQVGELKVSGLRATDAQLEVSAEDGLLSLEPLGFKLYQGTSQGSAKLDVRGEQPRFAARNRLEQIQVEPLLNDLMGDAKIRGTGTVVANVNGAGLEPEAIKRTLNGKVDLQFRDGAIKGINVAQIIRQARARLRGEAVPTDAPQETDFAELTATANIKNGVISNNDLAMKSPLLRVTGEGTVNLPQESLDYLLQASVVGSSKGQGGRDLDDLRGVTIPVRIAGAFADPTISPDLQGVLEARAKEEVQKRLEKEQQKVQEKIQEKLGDQLGDKLKGLLPQ